jgi:hypothetical protein
VPLGSTDACALVCIGALPQATARAHQQAWTKQRACTVLSFAGGIAERFPVCSSPPLSKAADHCLPVRLLALSARSRRFTTTFRSLVTGACFQTTITRSKFPICRFSAPLNFRHGPFGWLLPRLYRFAPVKSGSTLPTRCLTPIQCFRLRLEFPLSVRDLAPLRVKAFNPICRRKARLSDSPDNSSLPAIAIYWYSAD